MNVPNWITTGRVLLVPVFLVLAYGHSDLAAVGAFVIFLVASGSDFLDGYLARKHGRESRLGAFLDPLADKLLVGAALIVLVDTRSFPLWAALVIAGREIAVQILRTSIANAGGSLPASRRAKEKTMLQVVMVCWWLLPWDGTNLGHHAVMIAALVWTLWTGAEYFSARRAVKEVAH